MRNVVPPCKPNELALATFLVAHLCLGAIAALPLFGLTTLSGQTVVEADIAAWRLTDVVLSF